MTHADALGRRVAGAAPFHGGVEVDATRIQKVVKNEKNEKNFRDAEDSGNGFGSGSGLGARQRPEPLRGPGRDRGDPESGVSAAPGVVSPPPPFPGAFRGGLGDGRGLGGGRPVPVEPRRRGRRRSVRGERGRSVSRRVVRVVRVVRVGSRSVRGGCLRERCLRKCHARGDRAVAFRAFRVRTRTITGPRASRSERGPGVRRGPRCRERTRAGRRSIGARRGTVGTVWRRARRARVRVGHTKRARFSRAWRRHLRRVRHSVLVDTRVRVPSRVRRRTGHRQRRGTATFQESNRRSRRTRPAPSRAARASRHRTPRDSASRTPNLLASRSRTRTRTTRSAP